MKQIKKQRPPEEILKRKRLVSHFNDTKKKCHEKKIIHIHTHKLDSSALMPNIFIGNLSNTVISVLNFDCIAVAEQFAIEGRTCMLNMANAVNRGGGVVTGATAQEEELCRNSNLWFALKPSFYPMKDNEFIYSTDVNFFSDSYDFKCDIITCAAPCLINVKEIDEDKHFEIVREKITQILTYPLQLGCENLVLSAFGCGAFRNNPVFMSEMFKKMIKEIKPSYKNICFAITGAKTNNYEIFRKTLIDEF